MLKAFSLQKHHYIPLCAAQRENHIITPLGRRQALTVRRFFMEEQIRFDVVATSRELAAMQTLRLLGTSIATFETRKQKKKRRKNKKRIPRFDLLLNETKYLPLDFCGEMLENIERRYLVFPGGNDPANRYTLLVTHPNFIRLFTYMYVEDFSGDFPVHNCSIT